jgi:hypothetical protein
MPQDSGFELGFVGWIDLGLGMRKDAVKTCFEVFEVLRRS